MIDKLVVPFLVSLSGGNGGEETPRLAEMFAKAPQPLPCAVCGFGNSPSFVHVLSADTPKAGSGFVGLRYEQQEIDSFSDAELLAFADADLHAHSYDRRMAVRLGGSYGITDDFAIGVDLPYVDNRGLREGHHHAGTSEVHDNGDQSGLGDASLFAQWTCYRNAEAASSVGIYAGAKLPTGDTEQKTPDGERLEADHQLGSGSVNPLLGAAVSKGYGEMSIGVSGLYELATDGSQNSNLGDIARVNAGLGWTPAGGEGSSLRFTVLFELVGEWREKSEIGGATDEDTGGTSLFAAPGVRATWDGRWSWYGSLSVPVSEDHNGVQADTDFRVTTGLAVLF